MNAVLLVSHGSKSAKARQEIDALTERLKAKTGLAIFECAFLELERPSIQEALVSCVGKGATRVTILLNFLNSGRHVLEDIPRIVREFETAHPAVACKVTPCVGAHPDIDRLYLDLI